MYSNVHKQFGQNLDDVRKSIIHKIELFQNYLFYYMLYWFKIKILR